MKTYIQTQQEKGRYCVKSYLSTQEIKGLEDVGAFEDLDQLIAQNTRDTLKAVQDSLGEEKKRCEILSHVSHEINAGVTAHNTIHRKVTQALLEIGNVLIICWGIDLKRMSP